MECDPDFYHVWRGMYIIKGSLENTLIRVYRITAVLLLTIPLLFLLLSMDLQFVLKYRG